MYLSLGMTYDQYWDGDPEIPKYFREKFELDMARESSRMWYQGRYIYETMQQVAPIFNAFSKRKEPYPYVEEPFPMTARAAREAKAAREKRQLADAFERMSRWAEAFNNKFKKRKEV